MKPKNYRKSIGTSRIVLASILLAVNPVSAGTYYWDSDGDGTAGFGSAAGVWDAAGTGNLWSTSPTGDGVGGAAVADHATQADDDLNFGTPTLTYTGAATINGTVLATRVYQQSSHPTFVAGTAPKIDFGAAGIYETSNSNRSFPSMEVTGTQVTWKSARNMTINSVTSTVGKTILSTASEATISYPGRVKMNAEANLGNANAPLEFDHGTLSLQPGFPYTSLSALHAAHPVSFVANKNAGLDNSTGFGGSTPVTFTVDLPIDLGTGVFYTETSGGTASIIKLTSNSNNWSEVRMTTGILEISDLAQLGPNSAPLRFGTGTTELNNGTLRITGTSVTSFGTKPMLTTETKGVSFDIADAANTFTLDQPLNQGTGFFTKSGPGSFIINTTSTYTGATTVSGGKLSYGSALGLPTTAVTLNGVDAVLDFGAFNPSLTTVTLTNGSVTGSGTVTGTSFALNGGAGTTVSVGVNLAGASAALTKSNPGAATLSGDNTYTGTTAVNGGSLTVEGDHSGGGGWSIGINAAGSALTFPAGSSISVGAGNNVATVPGNGSANAARTIAVAGAVTTSSTSNVTIAGRNTLSINNGGSWNMQGGTLAVSVGNSGYSAVLNVNSGGSFTYSGSNTIIVSEASGSNNGSGALNLRGTFTTTTGFRNTGAGTNATATSSFNFDGGTLKISNDIGAIFESGGQPFNIAVAAGGGTIDTNGFNTATSLAITGAGGLTKAGGGTLTLSGTNTYAGNTTVSGGTLVLGAANTSNDASTVTIGTSGILQLTYAGTDTVDKLFIGTSQKAAGEYGKVGSVSPIIGIPEITGDGTLTVVSDPPSGTPFQLFMAPYTDLTGDNALPGADPDGDGLSNIAEFIMGGTAPNSSGAANRPVVAVISGHLTYSLLVPSGATFAGSPSPASTVQGVEVAVGGSLDLAAFAQSVEETAINPGLPGAPSGYEWHTFRLSDPISGQVRGFLRASFTNP